MRIWIVVVMATMTWWVSAPAMAQQQGGASNAMQDMKMPTPQGGDAASNGANAAEIAAFKAANASMMAEMDAVELTGNADVDLARLMIPHHRGAGAMAKVALTYGKDPQIRKVAEDIIKAQEAEIVFLQNWLKAKGQ